MLDPGASPKLAKDMERYGIIVGDDLVLEQTPSTKWSMATSLM